MLVRPWVGTIFLYNPVFLYIISIHIQKVNVYLTYFFGCFIITGKYFAGDKTLENNKLFEFMRQEMAEVKERLTRIETRLTELDAFMHEEKGKQVVWDRIKNNFISFTALIISIAVAVLSYLRLHK